MVFNQYDQIGPCYLCGCPVSDHCNANKVYKSRMVEKETTNEELKARYCSANSDKSMTEQVISGT